MGLEYAIDELYATGWTAQDSSGCQHAPDGRPFPGVQRVQDEFARAGYTLTLRYVDLFDCHRAEWRDAGGAAGAVVGQTEEEAAVYALGRLRRATAGAGA